MVIYSSNFELLLGISMGVIYVLITVSLVIAIIFFVAFIFTVRNGQYDDVLTPSIRMLFDTKSTKKQNSKPLDKS